MEKLTEMFQEDSLGGAHALVLALHLLRSKQINSYNKLLQLLIDEHSNINREIICLSHLRSILPVSLQLHSDLALQSLRMNCVKG